MAITENDIKLLKSQRMTDTADGGGRMTGNVVQSGVDNNIFDDVSNLDRVYGNVSLRKVFAAVLTPDTDKYLGARVVVDKPPADANVDTLLFGAASPFDTRDDARARVEAYMAAGAPYQGLLFGPHITGMSAISLIQREDRELPGIGDLFILRQEVPFKEQFVRITTVSASTLTFTDDTGDFKRKVVTCGIGDMLRYDFTGWEATRYDTGLDFTAKVRVYSTLVANAAQYYGIRPLSEPATRGSFALKADTIYSQLLPSAQIETPLVDLRTSGERVVLSAVGAPITFNVATAFNSTSGIAIGQAVTPGSLSISTGGQVITDAGGMLLLSGAEIGTVDYANGMLAITSPTASFPSTKTIVYQAAAAPIRTQHTASWAMTPATRSSTLVAIFNPPPKPGTLTLSYRAEGRWYTLTDEGDGALRNRFASVGAGSVNFVTGALSVTFASIPDAGTDVIATYGLTSADSVVQGVPFAIESKFTLANKGVAPNTVSLAWVADGVARTAQDNGQGLLTGDASGTVDYLEGVILFRPAVLPSANATVEIDYSWGAPIQETFTAPERFAPDGHVTLDLANPNVLPRTMRVEWNTVYAVEDLQMEGQVSTTVLSTTFIRNPTLVDPVVTVLDDGAGAFSSRPECGGTINYAAGTITFVPDTTIALPKAKWKQVSTGTHTIAGTTVAGTTTVVTETFKAVFDGFEYQTIGATFPADLGGYIKVTYRTTAAGTTATETFPMQARVDLTNSSQEPVVPGSVSLSFGGARYIDRQGSLLTDINPATGAGTVAGTINYLSGTAAFNVLPVGAANTGSILGMMTQQGLMPVTDVTFRTSSAPLRVGSLSVQFTLADDKDQQTVVVQANAQGGFTSPHVTGSVNYLTGVVSMRFGQYMTAAGNETEHWYDPDAIDADGKIWVAKAVVADTMRYAAVAYTYLPLDADILGLDPVRLPQDGRVPVFKSGRVVVVHNTQSMAPATVSNGQTLDTSRPRLARVRVLGADGDPITTGWAADLDAGTVTFTNVSGYSQPVTVEHRIEDEALCAEAQITGDLRLTRPLTHDYPAPGTYVSSAMIAGTKQAAAGEGFSQAAWTAEWSDTAIGTPITAQYNQTLHPIVVTNQGAIEERWALIFNNSTTFRVVGEASGEILVSNTGEVCAPLNPATGVPYFSIAPGGWGVGWAAGNVLRFNTRSANFPLWVSRTVLQSPAAPAGTDQIVISVRGDVDA